MADQKPSKSTPSGGFLRSVERERFGAAEIIAAGLSVVWLLAATLFFLLTPSSESGIAPNRFMVVLLAVFLPVALIWVGAAAARSGRMMREESARLQATIDAMRQAYINQTQDGGGGSNSSFDQKLDEIARAQKKTEAALAHMVASANIGAGMATAAPRPPERAALTAPKNGSASSDNAKSETAQPTLALGTPAETLVDPITTTDFVKALNFPEDENDADGFRALRVALRDRTSAGLVRSAQDVLTLLSEDGIYMDDLSPDRASADVWRRFASGERGRAVAALGGVRDRSCLALTSGRMKQDPVFRDAAHHFLRKFDQTFAAFEGFATDAEIVALAETRTARAFMLLGRVSGTFD